MARLFSNVYKTSGAFEKSTAISLIGPSLFTPIGLEPIFEVPAVLAGWFSFWPLISDARVILWLALMISGFARGST